MESIEAPITVSYLVGTFLVVQNADSNFAVKEIEIKFAERSEFSSFHNEYRIMEALNSTHDLRY